VGHTKRLERTKRSNNLKQEFGLGGQRPTNEPLVDPLDNGDLRDNLGDDQVVEPQQNQIVEEPLPNTTVQQLAPPENTDPPELDQTLEQFRETLRNEPSYAETLEQDDAIREESVSTNVVQRLEAAQAAIEHINNNVMQYGAGNQMEDIVETKGVSRNRAQALKQKNVVSDFRSMAPGAEEARSTVKAEHWKAGVCDDYAKVTLDYLRSQLTGVQLTRVAHDRHAFVLIGNPETEPADQVVVADPWPTRPQAVLWKDHFCYTESPKVNAEVNADGQVDHKARKEVKPNKKQSASKGKLRDTPLQEMLTQARKYNDIWFQRSALKEGKPVFYFDPTWTTEVKALKRAEFKASLLRSQHLSQKARRNLKID
jgi:hypothetical protein